MILSLIVAASENNVIGKGGKLPWHQSADLQYFRKVTRGHPVIMGRKTFESIGRVLPDRTNIVISNTLKQPPGGEYVVKGDLVEALIFCVNRGEKEVFVIGGGELMKSYLQLEKEFTELAKHPITDRLYLTRIHTDIDGGDAFFPADAINWKEWKQVGAAERHEADEKNDHAYTFLVYERHPRR